MIGLYSQSKAWWHLDRLSDLRAGRHPVPVHVQLVLSDLCQHDCSFCAYRMSNGLSTELFGTETTHNPHRMIPTTKAQEIIHDCAALGVKAIQFTGGGEPTLHPDHLALFALAQQLGLETALVTNGVRLDASHPVIRAMAWIRVSVDAGRKETYQAVRRCPKGHWARAWKNVEQLGRFSSTPFSGTLGIGYIVTPENYQEIWTAALLAERAGVHNMRIGAVFSDQGVSYYGDLLPEISREIMRAEEEVVGDLQIINLFGRRVEDLDHGRPTEPHCGYQKLTWYIGGDLHVYRCCNTAYTQQGLVANLVDTRLRDLFLGTEDVHEPFDARTCRFCQFRGQNKAISAALVEPIHVNFV